MNRHKGQNTGKKMSREKNEKGIPREESKGIIAMNIGKVILFSESRYWEWVKQFCGVMSSFIQLM